MFLIKLFSYFFSPQCWKPNISLARIYLMLLNKTSASKNKNGLIIATWVS